MSTNYSIPTAQAYFKSLFEISNFDWKKYIYFTS